MKSKFLNIFFFKEKYFYKTNILYNIYTESIENYFEILAAMAHCYALYSDKPIRTNLYSVPNETL